MVYESVWSCCATQALALAVAAALLGRRTIVMVLGCLYVVASRRQCAVRERFEVVRGADERRERADSFETSGPFT